MFILDGAQLFFYVDGSQGHFSENKATISLCLSVDQQQGHSYLRPLLLN
jgi:hypothetical protein